MALGASERFSLSVPKMLNVVTPVGVRIGVVADADADACVDECVVGAPAFWLGDLRRATAHTVTAPTASTSTTATISSARPDPRRSAGGYGPCWYPRPPD